MISVGTPKRSKSSVEFQHPAKGMDHCRNCKFFEEPQNRCQKVAGVILPNAWCRLFKEKA